MNVVYFLLMIIPLVLVHEWGHYVAARWFDVKCERFAIGMGPVVAAFRRGETQFSIRAFPLGGYVYMVGMQPDDEVDERDKGRALTDKPIWQRVIIYLAGPVANFLFAIPIFFLVFAPQLDRAGATIGVVTDGSAADVAGLEEGDRVVAIDGKRITYWDQLATLARGAPGETLAFEVERDGETLTLDVTPEPVEVVEPLLRSRVETVGQLGVLWSQHSAVVDVAPASLADQAGLRTFDRVVRVGDDTIETWLQLEAAFANAEGPTEIVVHRPQRLDDAWFAGHVLQTQTLTLSADEVEALGLRVADATVFVVEPGSPAMEAGLQTGDRVLGWNDTDINAIDVLLARIEGRANETHELHVERDGHPLTIELTPSVQEVVAEFRSERDETFIGFDGIPGSLAYVAPEPLRMGRVESLLNAAWRALTTTGEYLVAIFLGVVFLIIGSVDSSNLGGPLMIADVANRAARAGLLPFVELMAKISINLGIVNLVPVPGLDGGNLMLLAAESVKKEPLSYRTRQIIGYVGYVCIVLLMIFVFKNDIERYWVDVANWLNS